MDALRHLCASLVLLCWLAARTRVAHAIVLVVAGAMFVVPIVVPTPCEPVCTDVERHEFFGAEGEFLAVSHEGWKNTPSDPITLDGFVRAYEIGFRHFETDLRLSASGELIAFHTLDRGRDGTVPADAGPTARSLMHDARLAGGHWNFEFSDPGPEHVAAFAQLVADHVDRARVCVSFGRTLDQAKVDAFRREMPADLCTCASVAVRGRVGDVPLLRLLSGAWSGWSAGGGRQVSCAVVADVFADRSDVVEAGDGVVMFTWPAVRPETAERFRDLIDAGFDGIMTDDPAMLRSVLVEIGRWVEPTGQS